LITATPITADTLRFLFIGGREERAAAAAECAWFSKYPGRDEIERDSRLRLARGRFESRDAQASPVLI
jgi:hypothetical protein